MRRGGDMATDVWRRVGPRLTAALLIGLAAPAASQRAPSAPGRAATAVDRNAAAALAAIRQCAAEGQAVSVAIVGPEGELRALLRGDGAPPHSVESARRKAYTAASFGQPTAALADLIAAHPDAAGLARLDGTLFVGGGLPLLRDGKPVGGIGVAGANGPGLDEGCARVAIAGWSVAP